MHQLRACNLKRGSNAVVTLSTTLAPTGIAPERRLHTAAGGGYSEPVTPRDESGWAKGQFEHKCLSIMQSCWTEFGEFIIYFNEPVSPDWYPATPCGLCLM